MACLPQPYIHTHHLPVKVTIGPLPSHRPPTIKPGEIFASSASYFVLTSSPQNALLMPSYHDWHFVCLPS